MTRRARTRALALALALSLPACAPAPVASVHLALSAPPDVDAATLTVTGPGMDALVSAVALPGATFAVDVPAGAARRFELRASGAGAPRWFGLAIADLGAGDVTLTLPAVPGGAVHGRLTFAGAVVPGTTLTFAAFDPPTDFPSWYTVAPDAEGAYSAWLPAGSYVVMTGVAGAAVPPGRSAITIAQGVDSAFDVDLVAPDALARLALDVPSILQGGLVPAATSFTVSALAASGAPFTAYTGTVSFAGSDVALLDVPADYTFTPADAGVHTFSVTPLLPAGLGVLAVVDVADPSLSAAVALVVDDPTAIKGAAVELVMMVAGVVGGLLPLPGTLTLVALDANGLLASSYVGTVTFADSDVLLLTVPADYTFTAADGGTHVFPDALLPLVPVANAIVRAHDVAMPSIAGTLEVAF